MITAQDTLSDYEKICKEGISEEAKIVKVLRIVIKLLLSIRTNQMGGVKKSEVTQPKSEVTQQ